MTPAQHALVRIVKLCRQPNHRISRQIRLFELALEGLGVPAKARDEEVRKLIQRRRDFTAERNEATTRGDYEAAP